MFHALCAVHTTEDGVCLRGRTALHGRAKANGRPLGSLGSWLDIADRYDDRASHMAERRLPRPQRLDVRRRLTESTDAMCKRLLALERRQRFAEETEPLRAA